MEPPRGQRKGLGPTYTKHSRALILGTYPSPKSFESGFNYGHAQNRFWPLLAALTQRPVPQSVAEKKQLIQDSGLALWDVVERCTIVGAQDASIRDVVPNDIASLLQKAPIEAIFCNGAAAHKLYGQYCEAKTGLPAVRLPSTSPANATYSMNRLLDAWQPLRAYIRYPSK